MLPTPPQSPRPMSICSPEDRIGLVLGGSLELTGILGLGAYGTVYRARDIQTNVQYAVKTLNKVNIDLRQQKFQEREIQSHFAASQHPNVVSLSKILDGPDCTYVVMEFCPEGDLFSKITDESHYVGEDFKAGQVFLQILSAVQHCHSIGIYHRDLKPENILVMDNGWTVKLADFGLATPDRVTSDFGCGSTFYMSPECQTPGPGPLACYESAPNDVWSLGVILVNLTCGRNPWKRASMDDSTFRAFMRDRNFLKSILPISNELNCILQRVFEVDPSRRATVDELREYILRCPQLTTKVPSLVNTALPTPPASPIDQPVDTPLVVNGAFESVPQMDPLPAQQFPAPQTGYRTAPRPQQLLTPPSSGHCTPQSTIYTYPTKSVASGFCPTFYGNMPDFRRCGQVFSNFNVPQQFWAVTR